MHTIAQSSLKSSYCVILNKNKCTLNLLFFFFFLVLIVSILILLVICTIVGAILFLRRQQRQQSGMSEIILLTLYTNRDFLFCKLLMMILPNLKEQCHLELKMVIGQNNKKDTMILEVYIYF